MRPMPGQAAEGLHHRPGCIFIRVRCGLGMCIRASGPYPSHSFLMSRPVLETVDKPPSHCPDKVGKAFANPAKSARIARPYESTKHPSVRGPGTRPKMTVYGANMANIIATHHIQRHLYILKGHSMGLQVSTLASPFMQSVDLGHDCHDQIKTQYMQHRQASIDHYLLRHRCPYNDSIRIHRPDFRIMKTFALFPALEQPACARSPVRKRGNRREPAHPG